MTEKIKPREKVGIILKSGDEIIITCDKMTWMVNSYGKIASYKIHNSIPSLNYCDPAEIAAIITYGENL